MKKAIKSVFLSRQAKNPQATQGGDSSLALRVTWFMGYGGME
jgi:hypothetical protein